MARTPNQRCSATRKDGTPCRAQALADGLCFAHSPLTADKRRAAARQGGRNHANVVRLQGLVPPRLLTVYTRLETALAEVHSGELDPRAGTAMAALGRALVAVLTSGEIEDRLRTLEAKARDRG